MSTEAGALLTPTELVVHGWLLEHGPCSMRHVSDFMPLYWRTVAYALEALKSKGAVVQVVPQQQGRTRHLWQAVPAAMLAAQAPTPEMLHAAKVQAIVAARDAQAEWGARGELAIMAEQERRLNSYWARKAARAAAVASLALLVLAGGASAQAWNSWDAEMQATGSRAFVASGGAVATVEFYESAADGTPAGLGTGLAAYGAGAHPQDFNHAAQVWGPATGNAYPYAAKSTVPRGQDAGEAGTPAPLGVLDLQLHPPSSARLMVAAFRVPAAGTYTVSNVAARRVSGMGGPSQLRVFGPQLTEVLTLTALPDQAWVAGTSPVTVTAAAAGDAIYFAVDWAGDYAWDATEVAWTVTASGTPVPPVSVPPEQCPPPGPTDTGGPYLPTTGFVLVAMRECQQVGAQLVTGLSEEWACDRPGQDGGVMLRTAVNPTVASVTDPYHEGRTCELGIVAWRRSLPPGEGYVVWVGSTAGAAERVTGAFTMGAPAFAVQAEQGRPAAFTGAYFKGSD